MHIVIVDDNQADLHLLEQRIGQLFPDGGWTLHLINNGPSAIHLVRRHAGEKLLMLCDERMISMRGSDVLKELGNEGLLEKVTFILFSGHAMPTYPQHLGARLLVKPDDLDGYDALLKEVIGDWVGP